MYAHTKDLGSWNFPLFPPFYTFLFLFPLNWPYLALTIVSGIGYIVKLVLSGGGEYQYKIKVKEQYVWLLKTGWLLNRECRTKTFWSQFMFNVCLGHVLCVSCCADWVGGGPVRVTL